MLIKVAHEAMLRLLAFGRSLRLCLRLLLRFHGFNLTAGQCSTVKLVPVWPDQIYGNSADSSKHM